MSHSDFKRKPKLDKTVIIKKVILSQFKNSFPKFLLDFCSSYEPEPDPIEYDVDCPIEDLTTKKRTESRQVYKNTLRYPTRLNAPLIELDPGFFSAPEFDFSLNSDRYRQLSINKLYALKKKWPKLTGNKLNTFRFKAVETEQLIELEHMNSPHVNDKYKKIINKLAVINLNKELNMATKSKNKYNLTPEHLPPIPDMLAIFLSARAHSTDNLARSEELTDYYTDNNSFKAIMIDSENYTYYKFMYKSDIIFFISNDAYVSWTRNQGNEITMMDYEYLDYLLTITEVSYNMKIMSKMPEFRWAAKAFSLLEALKTLPMKYNDKVAVMKSMETVYQLCPESTSKSFHSVEPVIDCLFDLYEIFYNANLITSNFDFFLLQFYLPTGIVRGTSWIESMIKEALSMTPQQSLEFSSCHKFIYYAEIDENKGINKFLKRTFTPRPVDTNAIIEMTGMFNYEFLTSYVKKHAYLPTLKGALMKIEIIQKAHKLNNWSSLDLYPILWWADIEIHDALSHDIITDPLEYAKDKGSCKKDVSFGSQDSSKELFDVITRPNYVVGLFPFDEIDTEVEKKVTIKEEMAHTTTPKFPCKLSQKEREQKEEGRLFGALSTEHKHELSRLMKMAKIVLGYFSEQFMTITDKERKLILHEMAQMTLDSDIVSLLADIQGHNQSMQPDNTYELCRRIGLLYGEKDWGKLSYFFSNLTVICPKRYTNICYVSQGQLGGIEGFYNPIWTLHSLLMMKLFRKESGIDMPMLATYSDDIALLIRLAQLEQDSLDRMLQRLKRHCLRFGMIVKASQTIVSQHRITMLRKSYYDGILCDPTIKRLLSHTMFNCELYSSEEIEISSVTSATSSALELTNHPITCCLIKWIKNIALSVRTFANTFTDINQDMSIIPQILPQQLYTSINPQRDIESILQSLNMTAIKNDLTKNMTPDKSNSLEDMDYEFWRKLIKDKYGRDVTYERRKNVVDTIFGYLLDNNELQDIYFIFALTPINYSGLGVIPDLYLSVTGLSDSTARMIDYLFCYTKTFATNPEALLLLLDNILGIDKIKIKVNNPTPINTEFILNMPEGFIPAFSAESLLISNFPSGHRDNTANRLINSAVKEVFRVNCKNLAIIDLMNKVNNLQEFNTDIIKIFHTNFYPRIAQFYAETNITFIYNSLLGKVESTSSFLRRYKHLPKLRKKLLASTLWKAKNFFTERATIIPKLTTHSDIIVVLLERRKNMFPGINITDICEAEYESYIETCDYVNRNLVITTDRIKETRGNKIQYKAPKFGSEALYKGEMVDTGTILFRKSEVLAVKLLAISKWILYKTSMATIDSTNLQDMDVVQACNIALRTLGFPEYELLSNYISLPGGGEIAHRLKTFSYITSSTIRALPTLSTKYISYIDNTWITMYDLVDGNIHFDYIRHRLSYLAALRYSAYNEEAFIDHYKLNYSNHYKNVQIIISKKSPHNVNPNKYGTVLFEINTLNTSRVLFMSELEANEYDISDAAAGKLHNKVVDSKDNITKEARNIIVDFNRTLVTEWMEPYDTPFNKDIWIPLLKKIKPYMNILNIIKETDQIKFIEDTLTHYYKYFTLDEEIPLPIVDLDSMLFEIEDQFRSKHEEFIRSIDHIYYKLYHSESNEVYGKRVRNLLKLFAKHHSDPFLRSHVIHILTIEILLQGVVQFKYIYGKLIIDYPTTQVRFDDILKPSHFSLLSKPKPYVILLQTLMEMEYVDTTRLVKRGIELINSMLGEIGLNHFQMQHKIDPKKIRSQDIMYKNIVESRLNYPISILKSNKDVYIHMDKFLHLVNLREKVILNSGNPLVYNSTRGSDTYTLLYSIFIQLLSDKIISKDTNILDLCAGRGELRDAADQLELSIDSYGRSDIYTLINANTAVDYSTSIDLTDINTLPNITAYDFIIIDISFIKGNKQAIWATIIYLLKEQKNLMIRINSMVVPDDLYKTDLLMITNTIDIITMDDNRNAHPNVYLLIQPKAPHIKASDLSKIPDNYTPHILSHMKNLARQGLRLDVPLGININSATSMLLLDEGIYSYFDEILQQQTTPLTEKYNNLVQENKSILGNIVIDNYTYEKLKSKADIEFNLPKLITMPNIPSAKDTRFKGKDYDNFKKRWHDPKNKWYTCSLFTLNILQIPVLCMHHHEKFIKYLSKKYLFLITAGFYVKEGGIDLDITPYENLTSTTYTNDNKVSKLYRKVLPIILLEIYRDNIPAINEQYRLKFYIHGFRDPQIRREFILIKKLLCASTEFYTLLTNYPHIKLLNEKLKLILLDHEQNTRLGITYKLANRNLTVKAEPDYLNFELKNFDPQKALKQIEDMIVTKIIGAVNECQNVTNYTQGFVTTNSVDEYINNIFSFGLESRQAQIDAFFNSDMTREEAMMEFYGGDYGDFDPDTYYYDIDNESSTRDQETAPLELEEIDLVWADSVNES